jgi:hypothetical protein
MRPTRAREEKKEKSCLSLGIPLSHQYNLEKGQFFFALDLGAFSLPPKKYLWFVSIHKFSPPTPYCVFFFGLVDGFSFRCLQMLTQVSNVNFGTKNILIHMKMLRELPLVDVYIN